MTIVPVPKNDIPPWFNSSIKVDLTLSNKVRDLDDGSIRAIFYDFVSRLIEGNRFYTDGSKSEIGTGYGVYGQQSSVMPETKITYRLNDDESIFSAEAKAIVLVLTLTEMMKSPSVFQVFSVSMSALTAVKNIKNKNTLIKIIRRKLFASIHNVTLIWLPSHKGIFGMRLPTR